MASLTIVTGPDRGKRFELTGKLPTIGRDPSNVIRLHDSEISRKHAEFRRTEKGFVVFDLQSSNGTYLNGQRVKSSPLKTGDRLTVGQSELIFSAGQESQPQPQELAARINMVSRPDESESAIISSITKAEGSQILRHPETVSSRWLRDKLSNLAVMYETSEAISRISDVDQLLEHLLQRVFDSLKPDRACIMLKDSETGVLGVTGVKFADESDSEEQITLSRTIVDWVLKRVEGVIVLDAAQDSRFNKAKSIVKLGIREAICVPLAARHETLGVMYVDIKTDSKEVIANQRPINFTDDHLKLLMAIAHQAALAIEDSRFYQAMVQAERLAAIGQTIASLSHHIKNILQGLRAGSYVLEMGLNEKKLELVEQGWTTVAKNQDKIYNVVMDMLSYSKEREPALEMTNVNAVVQDVVELMQPRARDFNVALESKLGESLPEIAVDPEGISRAVLNIVTNAIDAVEGVENGKVVVATALEKSGRHLLVSITDNGVGIPPEQQQRIFNIFSSTKGERGSGLGLAVSKKIMTEHGGAIRVKSSVNKGSRFTLEIPVRDVPTADATEFEQHTESELRTQIP